MSQPTERTRERKQNSCAVEGAPAVLGGARLHDSISCRRLPNYPLDEHVNSFEIRCFEMKNQAM